MTRPSSGAESLPRSERLRSAAEFQRVFQQGKREERRGFVALWRVGSGARKVGFAASRQIPGATRRNRTRRRLREAYRRQRAAVPPGIEAVFVGRSAALTLPFVALVEEMRGVVTILARVVSPGEASHTALRGRR